MENSAQELLNSCVKEMNERAISRDTANERSMGSTVKAFNQMFNKDLTEEQGWHFMVLLKMSRSKGGEVRKDDYVDQAAYSALAGECALHERTITKAAYEAESNG